MFVSKVSMSLEKRLRRRPSGVVSKNDIGARRTDSLISWWKTRDELIVANAMENVRDRTPIAEIIKEQ